MTASIRSNIGTTDILISFEAQYEYADEKGFESNVIVSSEHYDGEHTHPLHLRFDGLWLQKSVLFALRDHLSQWLNQPLETLAKSELTGEFELATQKGQSLHLCFGERDDTISSRKPVIAVRIFAGGLKTEFHFVTDQSCLGLLVEELNQIVK